MVPAFACAPTDIVVVEFFEVGEFGRSSSNSRVALSLSHFRGFDFRAGWRSMEKNQREGICNLCFGPER